MDLHGRSTLILSVGIAAIALALGSGALLLRNPSAAPAPEKSTRPPDPPPDAAPKPPTAPPPPPPAPPLPADPLLRQWALSIRSHHRQGVEGAQSAILARETEYAEKLKALAKEDLDPRIRAFTVSLLSRMKSPPAEEFFIDRLSDPEQYPRTSALAALERTGTAACLPAVDRLASSDPVPEVRAAAAKAAKAVRSR
jgi:hypothetical protein